MNRNVNSFWPLDLNTARESRHPHEYAVKLPAEAKPYGVLCKKCPRTVSGWGRCISLPKSGKPRMCRWLSAARNLGEGALFDQDGEPNREIECFYSYQEAKI
jgi:hypothetical protein